MNLQLPFESVLLAIFVTNSLNVHGGPLCAPTHKNVFELFVFQQDFYFGIWVVKKSNENIVFIYITLFCVFRWFARR
jgi:hypothetical protein